MIQLYGRHTSYNVQKVLWTLDELGLEFDHTNLGGRYGGLNTAKFGALNPNDKIPVLTDDGLVVWELNAIVRYLAAEYGQGALWPVQSADRSHADQWMEWAVNNLLPEFISLFWAYYRTPGSQRDFKTIDLAQLKCEGLYRLLDAHLSDGRFLVGDSFTMGDIPTATSLYRYFEMGLQVQKPPNVMVWYSRLMEREPFRSRVAEPFDELFGRLDY